MSTEQPIENWREIPDFPGYRVSDAGRVQTCKLRRSRSGRRSSTWHDLKVQRREKGHLAVGFRVGDGRRHWRYVHRLVLEAFVGPCPAGMECCHGDGDASNNRLSNLRWDTHAENMHEKKNQKLTREQVGEIRRLRREGETLRGIAIRFGISHGHVHHVTSGQQWKLSP